MLAKDIMRSRVVTVPPEMTVRELARLFTDREISGAPVVDRRGKVLGVVSQTDIVRFDREARPAAEPAAAHAGGPELRQVPRGFQVENPDFTRVTDVMTPAALTGEEDTPVRDLAKLMLRKHIHRVVITREGKVCGIVTSMDLLRALLELLDDYEPA